MSLVILIVSVMGFVLGARLLKILDRAVKVYEEKNSPQEPAENE